MKRLGKILVLAAVAMLAMGVWATGVFAGGVTPGDDQTSLTVRINPLEDFFNKRYAQGADAVMRAIPAYGKISTVSVLFFNGETKVKTAQLTKDQPSVVLSGGRTTANKVEVQIKLVGVADPVVRTFNLKTNQAIIDISAIPDSKNANIYQIRVQKEKDPR